MIDDLLSELAANGQVRFYVRVQPSAPISMIQSRHTDGSLKISIAAAPENNKANLALIRLLADKFRVHRQNVRIVTGTLSRQKLVEITTA